MRWFWYGLAGLNAFCALDSASRGNMGLALFYGLNTILDVYLGKKERTA